VPSIEWVSPKPAPTKLPTSKGRPFWPGLSDMAPVATWLALIVCSLAFLLTIRTPPGPFVLVHYLSLMIAVGALASWIATKWKAKWAGAIAIVSAIVTAVLWGRSDYYIDHWDEPTKATPGTIYFTDYIYRGDDKPFYRRLHIQQKVGGTHHVEGAFSDSGKQHGRWHGYTLSSGGIESHDDWYWYGERVSEGEWHLRNR
jgi:hypothetical protein